MSLAKTLGRAFKVPKAKPRVLPTPQGRAPHIDWITVAETFVWDAVNDPDASKERQQGVFHPSAGLVEDSGHCLRQIVFDMLCSPRSATRIDPKLGRVLIKGTARHKELNALFKKMAEKEHMGIVAFEHDIPTVHPWLPIEGEADGIVTLQSGHRYVVDFKTISEKQAKNLMEPKFQHRVQLNTYMGCLGESTGYMLYENKSNQRFLGPMNRFRIDFDQELFERTEQYCISILRDYVNAQNMPEFAQGVCESNVMFCSYQEACNHMLKDGEWHEVDFRNEALVNRHLNVLPP